MQEFDLQSTWDDTDAKAEQWYRQLRPELVQLARQQNASVLARLQRLMWREIVLGSIFFVVVLLLFYREDTSWVTLLYTLLLFLGGCWMSYYAHNKFSERIAAIPTMNVIESTTAYLHEVTQYRQRLTRLSLLISPLAVLAGYSIGVMLNHSYEVLLEPSFWVKTLLSMLVFGGLIYYGSRWYYRFFIGKRETELRALLERLTGANGE
ncbi:MAG: hypothetical protein AAGJ82_07220 [Bacteroidota bacterium]